jgi:hypothetical protein
MNDEQMEVQADELLLGLREMVRVAKATPLCPDCARPLIARPEQRRFIENNRYIECEHGHVWYLDESLLDGGSASKGDR